MKTYRTTLGETKNVQATVNFLSNNGKIQSLNFAVPTSCPKYQQQVEAEHSYWDWERLEVNKDELEVLGYLGSGSFAAVNKVKWQGQFHALKTLHNQAWSVRRRGFPYTVRREVAILAHLASLGHQHLCRLTGIVTEPKLALLFELCDGGTLFAAIRDESVPPMSWQHRIIVLRQITEALIHLHENHVVHRDLKNNNVLFLSALTPDATPHTKVTDVGLARWLVEHVGEEGKMTYTCSTGALTPLASVDWHAPEMATGFYGTAVDIYSFGVILLEVTTWVGMLPDDWRDAFNELQKKEDCAKLTSLAAECLAEQSKRPSALHLLDAINSLTPTDGEDFVNAWELLI
jgi:serine/threonine protein kinase